MATRRYDNDELQRYFQAEVVPKKEETKRIVGALMPDLYKLFEFIDKRDSRLYQQVAYVGSSYQGLKVMRSDEFDYNLYIAINIDQKWCIRSDPGVFYGFKGCDTELKHQAHTKPQDRGDGVLTNLHNTMNEKDYVIVQKMRPLVHPGEGYFTVSPGPDILKEFHDMAFGQDLVPWLVKLKLKRKLMEALEKPSYFKG